MCHICVPARWWFRRRLLEAATGKSFPCAFGSGQLVTLDRVAGRLLKEEASARFGALAVDMEAAGVAAAAAEYNREFAAIKVISDGADEDLGFLSGFVKPEGFETGRFIAHIALRPGLWPKRGGTESKQQTGCHGVAERGRRMYERLAELFRQSTPDAAAASLMKERVIEKNGGHSQNEARFAAIGFDSRPNAGRCLLRTE